MNDTGLVPTRDISPEEITRYRSDGYLVLRDVVEAAKITAFRDAVREVVARHAEPRPPAPLRDTYAKAFIQVFNAWAFDPRVRELVFDPGLADLAARLMGVPTLRLFCDEILYKEPGAGHTPWHQDLSACPFKPNTGITLWIPLCEVSEEMGTMYFAHGSHKAGELGPYDISDDTDRDLGAFVHEQKLTCVDTGPMRPGDLSFHDGWMVHGAHENHTQKLREVIVLHYFPDGQRVAVPTNPTRERLLSAVAPHLQPGDLADCNLWPRVPQ